MKEEYFSKQNIADTSLHFLERIKPLRDTRAWTFNTKKSALLVIDMQQYFLDPVSHAFIPSSPAIIPNIKKLQQAFLESKRPVFQTRHINTPEDAGRMKHWWQDIINADNPFSHLSPHVKIKGGILFEKSQYDCFYQTQLRQKLLASGIAQLVIAGVMTHLCCESTARSAFINGFEVFFMIDGTATYNREFHLATLINLAHGFATPMLTDELIERLI